MEKLLHERLREYGESGTRIGHSSPLVQALEHYQLTPRLDNVYGESCFFRKLADEIERYYIPRPRFEDGEPVQFGDEAQVRDDLGEVCKMVFNEGGCEEVMIGFEYDSSASHYMVVDGEFVKRPAPKVLDADGVEIKVSDEVYSLLNDGEEPFGTCYVVTAIDTSRELPVSCGHWGQREWIFKGTSLTHREPDSMSKAMERFESILDDGDGLNYEAEDNLREVYHRLTALIERGA